MAKFVQIRLVGVWRRKRAGIVNMTMKKRVMQRLDCQNDGFVFLGLLLKAIFLFIGGCEMKRGQKLNV